MSLLNHNEQYDLATSMQLESEHEIEEKVRTLAADYLARRNSEIQMFNRQPPPTRTNLVLQTSQGLRGATAGYPSPQATFSMTLDAHYIELYIDVAPGIDGFLAQIIAEEQLREQIGRIDTTP